MATGLEMVSFHSNPKERQCQRMLKLPHNCIRGIKINKHLKLADCKPYGNSPSREAVQTPAHTISKQGLGREARRGLHRLE